jgi:septal ring factor EnvC (AmiA/AmiB activator)
VEGVRKWTDEKIKKELSEREAIHSKMKQECDRIRNEMNKLDNQLFELEKEFDPLDHDLHVLENRLFKNQFDNEIDLCDALEHPPDRLVRKKYRRELPPHIL